MQGPRPRHRDHTAGRLISRTSSRTGWPGTQTRTKRRGPSSLSQELRARQPGWTPPPPQRGPR
eukprot:6411828-Lingulodinium_polyedra.AAC.1